MSIQGVRYTPPHTLDIVDSLRIFLSKLIITYILILVFFILFPIAISSIHAQENLLLNTRSEGYFMWDPPINLSNRRNMVYSLSLIKYRLSSILSTKDKIPFYTWYNIRYGYSELESGEEVYVPVLKELVGKCINLNHYPPSEWIL